MPYFTKFDGTSDPRSHIKMYHRTMNSYQVSMEAMIQFFPQSLTGPALTWYLSEEEKKIRTCEDLQHLFVSQYRYNTQVDVTRTDLETTSQERSETFSHRQGSKRFGKILGSQRMIKSLIAFKSSVTRFRTNFTNNGRPATLLFEELLRPPPFRPPPRLKPRPPEPRPPL
ncbi:hypothetical protein Droror1_Dr00028314 [Drosera rotundifolia]